MKKTGIILLVYSCILGGCTGQSVKRNIPAEVTVNREQLLDKIKGGWAGQVIGVCFGQPTEFRYLETMIPDSVELEWNSDLAKRYFNNDDIYMDLTFVRIFERLGLNAPIDSFATAFAYAGYSLHHANQAARYNIQHGIMPPASGHWLNNPHADDIDYQIESDFAGLMSPGMPNAASEVSDGIGHIMNYGDGWYGGVYVGAMYALAAVSDEIPFIVTEALKTIPEQSRFYQCIHSVVENWRKNPGDWKEAWVECEKNWNFNECPESIKRESIGKELAELEEASFEGNGIVVRGELTCADNKYSALVEVSLDGKIADTIDLPAGNHDRRLDIYWNYQLSTGAHRINIKWLNPRNDAKIQVSDMVFYGTEENE